MAIVAMLFIAAATSHECDFSAAPIKTLLDIRSERQVRFFVR